MSRIILALLVLVAVTAALPDPQFSPVYCPGINQEFALCRYDIEPSCSYPDFKGFPQYCRPGCQCKEGYVRNLANECIPRYLCNTYPMPYPTKQKEN